MNTKLSIICDKFIEACWLAAVVLSPLYMNIYTHRMFEPDKACIIRSLAILMLVFYITKVVDNLITKRQVKSLPDSALPVKTECYNYSDITHFIRTPLFISFLLFVIAYIISVIFSAVPYNSIWGSYDRLQGLYTTASYWVLFLLVAINIKSKDQINRLITAIILTSIPIVIYSFLQKFRLDPIPWQQMDPSRRVSATMGNPMFLGGYLIIVIPLTISQLINLIIDRRILTSVFYGLVALLQVITVFLTKARGPIFAVFIGISACILIYALVKHKRNLILLGVITLFVGIIFIVLSCLLTLESFRKLPDDNKIKTLWYDTVGKLIDTGYPGYCEPYKPTRDYHLRSKSILWNGVWKLIADKDEPYRFFIGYGPETLSTIYYKYYTMELAEIEGPIVHTDRAHNGFLDIWVRHGVIGLAGYLWLLGAVFLVAIKTLRSRADSDNNFLNIIVIGLLAGIISHLVELIGGIAIVSTLTYFWVFIGAIWALYRMKSMPDRPISPTDTEVPAESTGEESKFITIYSTCNPTELSLIKMRLEGSGISFVIHNENLDPAVFGFVSAELQVLPDDIEKIRDLLSDIIKEENLSEEIYKVDIPFISKISHWNIYLFAGYFLITVIIAFILFHFSFPAAKIITPEVKAAKDALLTGFFMWLVFGFVAGIFLWYRLLFWSFVGQTLIMTVIMVRKYWPDDTTNTDALTIYSWLWFLVGLIIGALSIRTDKKAEKWGSPESVAIGIILLLLSIFTISTTNLPVLRADGFYKFCFSYDMSAEEAMRQGVRDRAYEIRLACIRYFQNALRFAPNERAYLNGSGRNFLELAKLDVMLGKKPDNKLSQPPSMDELTQLDAGRFRDFSQRDFTLCSFSCIKRAWELDPNNFERLIALIRIYRYWGDLDRDITKFQEARRLCDLARKASPLNTKTDYEIKELEQRLPR